MPSQFPYPRKSSSSPSPSFYHPASRSTYASIRRRANLRSVALLVLGSIFALWLLLYLLARSGTSRSPSRKAYRPPGTPEVVIVTTIDPALSQTHKEYLVENRRDYAARHGHAIFFPNTTDYDLMPNVPSSWATIPALRHAMTLYPHTPWLWYLSSTALIMAPSTKVDAHLLNPQKLEELMIPNQPVVPPDSVIKTFPHLRGERVDLVISQDTEGLAGGSFFVRTGEWAKYFLDAWYDPLYRSYKFQKAEGHALEHMVQWHGTMLAKMALVPQRRLNSYTRETGGNGNGKSGESWA